MAADRSDNRPDIEVLSEELTDTRVKLERTLAENDSLLDRLRKVAVERDRIREEADNRSAFWRRRFHATAGVVIAVIIVTSFASWTISKRLQWVRDDVTDVKTSMRVIEKATTKYARAVSTSSPIEFDDRDTELSRLRSEAARLRLHVTRLREAVSVMKNVSNSRDETEKETAARLTNEYEEKLREFDKEKASEIEKLHNEIEKLRNEVAQAKLAKGIAIPALIDALNHADVSVRLAAEQALKHLTNRDLGTDQDRWRRWWQANRLKFLVD